MSRRKNTRRLMLLVLVALGLYSVTSAGAAEPPALDAVESEQGVLITEGDARVLFFQRRPKSHEGRHTRSNYVHPLYDLDGRVLTEDFPADHLHHRGIFWTWHQVWVGDQAIGDPWAIRDFSWDVREVRIERDKPDSIALQTLVLWKSPLWKDAQGRLKPLVREEATIRVHRATSNTRAIDFEIRLLALEDELLLGGSNDAKGYGGFSVRLRLPEGVQMIGRGGPVTPKTRAVEAGPWLDVSAPFAETAEPSGVAILCHPSNPGFPQPWILRASESMQNVVYPGREPVLLSTETPLVLRYRLVIHRGPGTPERGNGWLEEYRQEVLPLP